MTQRSEKEKMIAGELYFSADPELAADRRFAREQMTIINQVTEGETRSLLVKETFGHVENRADIEPNIRFDYGYNISVGKNFYANYDCVLLDVCPITFGDNCMLGPNVQIYTADHPLHPVKRNSGLESGSPVRIGDNVWLGGSSVVLPGVSLGNNVVVGAGSVVTKSFPDNVVVAGNPAQVVRVIELEAALFEPLESQRTKIDAIDKEITELLEQRMNQVAEIARVKQEVGKEVLDNGREEEVLQNIAKSVKDMRYETTIVDTFKDIMKHSRAYQKRQMEE